MAKAKLSTINIKGKAYVTVNERIKYFREHFDGYGLETELIECTFEGCLMRAVIRNESGAIVATGFAREERADKSSPVNKTSYVENCETSAWGRALANFGIGVDDSVASADEVAIAIKSQPAPPAPTEPPPPKLITDATIELLLTTADKLTAFASRDLFRAWIHNTCKVDLGAITEERAVKIVAFLTETPDVSQWPAAQVAALTAAMKLAAAK